MMKTALEYDKGPIAVRYPRLNGVGVPMDEPMRTIPIGKWEVVREGQQLAVLAVGPMVQLALEAAESLAKEGISVEVVNARFLKPLDDQMLMSLATRGLPILTIEEACLPGGFGSAVLEFYAERGWHELRLRMLGIEDRFIEHGSVKEQRAEVGLTAEAVMETARAMLKPQLTRQRA
jgi:1-deoxy-D-xylulose-5-phosphate synthase